MSSTEDSLKSCPVCGAEEYQGDKRWLNVVSDEHYYAVFCLCGAASLVKDSKQKAVDSWNTRDYSDTQVFSSPYRVHKSMVTLACAGNLTTLPLPTILQILSAENVTGILQFTRGQSRISLCLKEGNIVAANGNALPRMGQLLKEFIPLEKLKGASKQARSLGKRLSKVLVELKYISQDALRDLFRQHIREAILTLLLWREGDFELQECPVDIDEQAIPNINTAVLILETVRQIHTWAGLEECFRNGDEEFQTAGVPIQQHVFCVNTPGTSPPC